MMAGVSSRALIGLLLCGASSACGGPPMRPGPLQEGRIDSEPSMECLPDPDVADTAFTRRMQFGLTLAAESFLIPPPPPPSRQIAANLQAWAEQRLAPWLERKSHTVEAARRELDLAAEEDHRQRIIGGAVVGLMYEDVARLLASIPAPEELDDEPEIQEIYRRILRSHARPFLEHARRAYRACALNARQPEGMRHWSRFCRGRRDRLEDADAPVEGPASGETEVEVLTD